MRHTLELSSSLFNGFRKTYEVENRKLLLFQIDDQIHLIENKCGHFGISLLDAVISKKGITCSQHGIEFSLIDGTNLNRPWENCDPIHIYKWHIHQGWISIEL